MRPSTAGEEELQLQLALAMSKEEHDDEVRRQRTDDIKLQMAVDESYKVSRVATSKNSFIVVFTVAPFICSPMLCCTLPLLKIHSLVWKGISLFNRKILCHES